MAGKRSATSELNHENWNECEEPEEAGKFATAPKEELQKRVIRTAKRKLQSADGASKSAFSGFTGFKSTSVSTPSASPFSFLQKSSTTTVPVNTDAKSVFSTIGSSNNGSSSTLSENGMSQFSKKELKSTESVKTNDEPIGSKKSTNYYAKIKGLNKSVAKWIQKHVDEDPCCILTPIFQDYNKFLSDIESEENGKLKDDKLSSDKMLLETSSSKVPSSTSSFTSTSTSSPSIFSSSTNPLGIKSIFDKPTNIFGVKKDTSIDNPFLQKSKSDKSDEKESFVDATSTSSSTTTTSTVTDKTETSGSNKTTFSPSTPVFSFGQNTSTTNPSAGFSFGSGKPFTFGNTVTAPKDAEVKPAEAENEDEYEPPKAEVKAVSEDGAIYEQRCKVFVKKDGNFTDRGVGTLFLKPTPNDKIQLLVRAETSIGNLLLNTLLTESIPTKRMNKNNVMLVCLPLPDSTPPPTPVLLRVKTSEEADRLLEALDNNKK